MMYYCTCSLAFERYLEGSYASQKWLDGWKLYRHDGDIRTHIFEKYWGNHFSVFHLLLQDGGLADKTGMWLWLQPYGASIDFGGVAYQVLSPLLTEVKRCLLEMQEAFPWILDAYAIDPHHWMIKLSHDHYIENLVVTPLSKIEGRSLNDCLPQGAQLSVWLKLSNQFEQFFQERREKYHTIHGLWLSGFGHYKKLHLEPLIPIQSIYTNMFEYQMAAVASRVPYSMFIKNIDSPHVLGVYEYFSHESDWENYITQSSSLSCLFVGSPYCDHYWEITSIRWPLFVSIKESLKQATKYLGL